MDYKKMIELRKNPYTNRELFEIIAEKIKKEGCWPRGVDYVIAGEEEICLTDCSFNVYAQVEYGEVEGIYLKIGYKEADDQVATSFCIAKTLDTNRKAMRTMADLGANFVVEITEYIKANLYDFIWQGYFVIAYNEKGYALYKYHCETEEIALQKYLAAKEKAYRVVMLASSSRKVLQDSIAG